MKPEELTALHVFLCDLSEVSGPELGDYGSSQEYKDFVHVTLCDLNDLIHDIRVRISYHHSQNKES